MNTKTCSGCKEEKPIENFGKDRRTKDGLLCYCNRCSRRKQQDRYWKKKGGKPQVIIPEELEGKVRITVEHNIRYLECIDCGKPKEGDQQRNERCYSCSAKNKDNQYNQREGFRICKKCGEEKELNEDNFIFLKKRNLWRGSCKPCEAKIKRDYRKKLLERDQEFRLRLSVSTAVGAALRKGEGTKRGSSILAHLPYSIPELREHIESQFEAGMSWENWGNGEGCWNIDHIYPQAKLPYDSMDHPNFQKAWALSNLRPLWARENKQKSDKIIKELIDPELFP